MKTITNIILRMTTEFDNMKRSIDLSIPATNGLIKAIRKSKYLYKYHRRGERMKK